MFKKLLIANRGEIALRILRSCKEMGIKTVSVHSQADENAMHVRFSDESVCIGSPPSSASYLNIAAIISAAQLTGVDAIHPGIGFMAENPKFASIVTEHGFCFIGPSEEHIAMMGDKIKAKQFIDKLGIPSIPGSKLLHSKAEALEAAKAIGYPVMLKAAGGGGGKGIRILDSPASLSQNFEVAGLEAAKYFGDGSLYLEKYLVNPRHLEVQVLGDGKGNVIHLGARDCSIQRSHQKLVEESAHNLPANIAQGLFAAATKITKQLGYKNAGTVEFLYAPEAGEFYFMEMNTRLQVEHPVTEAVTGVDLVKQQINVAASSKLSLTQSQVQFRGHSIECRINAEDSETLAPSPGKITGYHPPGGIGVRVDTGLYQDYEVPPWYDSLVAKLIIHADDRQACIKRCKVALDEFVIDGITTNLGLYRRLITSSDFEKGKCHVGWFEQFAKT